MGRLAGVGVLVTRPEHQAAGLSRLIQAEGGATLVLPALDIHASPERPAIKAAIGPVDRFNLIVFISANAVRFGVDLLGQRRDLRLAAIGRATAQALNAAGHRVSLIPVDGSDSEALLAAPEIAHMAGQRVLIVRGKGGREALAETLRARGAEVVYAEVYERSPARPARKALDELEELWRHGGVDVYTATSSELLEALVAILTPRCRGLMDSTAMLTGAARVVDRAQRLGLGSPVILAEAPEDEALLAALVRWQERRLQRPQS